MADSIQLQIQKAICNHLMGITPANGYDFDLSASVFRGRGLFGTSDPLPMLSLLESTQPPTGPVAGHNNIEQYNEWLLLLQGFVDDDPANPTDPAYVLKAVVHERLSQIIAMNTNPGRPDKPAYPDVYMLGGLIGDMTISPGIVRPPEQGVSSKAYFYLPLLVKYAFNASRPTGAG